MQDKHLFCYFISEGSVTHNQLIPNFEQLNIKFNTHCYKGLLIVLIIL